MGDRDHFEDYREQTQVKHEILAAYLPAYFHILKGNNKNLLFVDGFAGRGTYTKAATGEMIDGSPLRALKLIAANSDFSAKVSTVFIESDPFLYEQLDKTIADFYQKHAHIRKPECINGDFAAHTSELVQQARGKLAPTFLFVDPCGVSGVSFTAIKEVMNCDQCEVFIFFNSDGIGRVLGLEKLSGVLVDLMGSTQRAQAVYDGWRQTAKTIQRERIILEHYLDALEHDANVTFKTAFRVEYEGKQKTSHYLIHGTKHPLGFKIMKDVMWRRGHAASQQGGLEFRQAGRTDFYPLFDDRGTGIKTEILNALAAGNLRVAVFCDEWVRRPDDRRCEPAYKTALLELEADHKIEVLGKDGTTPTPAGARRKLLGKPTLANEYYVRLSKPKPN